ncbi:hypothetical protein VIAG107301_12375 [Vibrio agarivorans]
MSKSLPNIYGIALMQNPLLGLPIPAYKNFEIGNVIRKLFFACSFFSTLHSK